MPNQYILFHCNLCSAHISSDPAWLDYGRSQVMVHYHCMCQHYDYGNVQMQLFDLEQYIDV
jgi:hypothetical protein